MKHLLISVSFLFILTFCGCSVKETAALECVSDTLEVLPEPAFYLAAAIPQEACLSLSADGGKFSVFSHEDYEIVEEIFLADSADSALEHVTGRGFSALSPIQLSSNPLSEYRFAWTAAGEEGALACSGTLLFDGTYYYSVSVQCAAEKEKMHHDAFSDLLASVSLQET